MKFRSLLLTLALLGLASACSSEAGDGLSAASTTSEVPVETTSSPSSPTRQCPDPDVAADHVEGLLAVTYDYQGSESPADLARRAQAVVIGTVTGLDSGADGYWLDVEDVEILDGAIEEPTRIWVESSPAATEPDPRLVMGTMVLAFLYDDPAAERGNMVAIEGLWLACGTDGLAFSAKLDPGGDGWPTEPTIARLIAEAG